MTFSVVIPARNEGKMLPHCLESLKRQKFPKDDIEIIVVDNNSKDKTAKIAKKFGVKVLFESKKGIAYARQKGAQNAKGDIIVSIDADCELPPDFLKKIARRFSDKNVVGLCGRALFDQDTPLPIHLGAKLLSNYAHFYSKMFNKTPICWAFNFSFRRSDFIKKGGYNLNLPSLLAGYNTQGSDEYELVKKLISRRKKIIFDKNITLKTSGRRYKNRLVYWFFIEYIIGFMLNEKIYSVSGKMIPIPSYYDRVSPSFSPFLSFNSFIYFSLLSKRKYNLRKFKEKFSSLAATLENFSQKLN